MSGEDTAHGKEDEETSKETAFVVGENSDTAGAVVVLHRF